MPVKIINSREAYTNKELSIMIKEKMEELNLNLNSLYEKYKQYFLSEDEVNLVLTGDVYFNYDIYKFLEEFLDISLDELTREVQDDISVSARGAVDSEDQLIEILNYLYDQMIKHRRNNANQKTTFNKYLLGKTLLNYNDYDIEEFVEIFKKEFNIGNKEEDYPLDLFNILENKPGFYILSFPNDVEISGLTIIKNSVKENEKYICIYVNTKEPIGRQLFTVAHELYHILFEKSDESASYYKNRMSSPIEKRAEEFASRLIIPRDLLAKKIKNLKKSKNRSLNMLDIVKLQEEFNVSFQSIVYVINNTSSKSDLKWGKFYDMLPKPEEKFKMAYTSEKYRQQIVSETKKYTNLNLIKESFVLPALFNSDLKESLQKNLIDDYEYNQILNFFED
ncbi:hypothetical protein UT300005_32820 [Clostridium sp. CTA-5]